MFIVVIVSGLRPPIVYTYLTGVVTVAVTLNTTEVDEPEQKLPVEPPDDELSFAVWAETIPAEKRRINTVNIIWVIFFVFRKLKKLCNKS